MEHIMVVDAPSETSTEDCQRLLNEPYAAGYYLVHTSTRKDGSTRAIYRQRVRGRENPERNEAVRIVTENKNLSARRLSQLLLERGITRSRCWVNETRQELAKGDLSKPK